MSKVTTIRLRFTGHAVGDHNMDVTHLGSSLFAVGELCKITNREFNGDQANVHVFVRTDHEHQCFEIVLEVFQSLLSNVQGLIGHPQTQTIKEILEWIGIIGGPSFGLYKFLGWRKGRKVEVTEIVEKEGKEILTVQIEKGEEKITVRKEVWDLSQNSEAVKMAAKTIQPLQEDGYETIEFEESPDKVQKISKQEAICISASARNVEKPMEEPQVFIAWLSVYAPVYEANAKRWRFRFGQNIEYFDISRTNIAKDAIERGGALINDLYHVKVELTQSFNDSGKVKNTCSIVEVIEFRPASKIVSQAEIVPDNDES